MAETPKRFPLVLTEVERNALVNIVLTYNYQTLTIDWPAPSVEQMNLADSVLKRLGIDFDYVPDGKGKTDIIITDSTGVYLAAKEETLNRAMQGDEGEAILAKVRRYLGQ